MDGLTDSIQKKLHFFTSKQRQREIVESIYVIVGEWIFTEAKNKHESNAFGLQDLAGKH